MSHEIKVPQTTDKTSRAAADHAGNAIASRPAVSPLQRVHKHADADDMTSADMVSPVQRQVQPIGEQAVVQRTVKFSGGDNAAYLDTIIRQWSERQEYYAMAEDDEGIDLDIFLDESKKDEKALNVVGKTHGIINIEGGVKAFYELDDHVKDKEQALGVAQKNGDYLKMTSMKISITINASPFMRIFGPSGPTGESRNVDLSLEELMVVFAHEWELHVVPMLDFYRMVRVQQQNILESGQPDDELYDTSLEPILELLRGGEDEEHANIKNIGFLFAALQNAKTAMGPTREGAYVKAGEEREMQNLDVTAEEKNRWVLRTYARNVLASGGFNVIGEDHAESDSRREVERMINEYADIDVASYFQEGEYMYEKEDGTPAKGDPDHRRAGFCAAMVVAAIQGVIEDLAGYETNGLPGDLTDFIDLTEKEFETAETGEDVLSECVVLKDYVQVIEFFIAQARAARKNINAIIENIQKGDARKLNADNISRLKEGYLPALNSISLDIIRMGIGIDDPQNVETAMQKFSAEDNSFNKAKMSYARSFGMHMAAQAANEPGVWKVGYIHIEEIEQLCKEHQFTRGYNLISREEYNALIGKMLPLLPL